jgi:hypothetical protein
MKIDASCCAGLACSLDTITYMALIRPRVAKQNQYLISVFQISTDLQKLYILDHMTSRQNHSANSSIKLFIMGTIWHATRGTYLAVSPVIPHYSSSKPACYKIFKFYLTESDQSCFFFYMHVSYICVTYQHL